MKTFFKEKRPVVRSLVIACVVMMGVGVSTEAYSASAPLQCSYQKVPQPLTFTSGPLQGQNIDSVLSEYVSLGDVGLQRGIVRSSSAKIKKASELLQAGKYVTVQQYVSRCRQLAQR